MTTNIQPVEIAGEHWITIKMDGCDMEPRGPFSTTEAAEAAATKFGAICRAVLRQPVKIGVRQPAKRRP